MSLGDTVHYLLVGNPLSNSVISTAAGIAKSTGLISSKTTPGSSRSVTTKNMANSLPLWKLAGNNLYFVRLAGLSGATAVILGAYGSHRKYPDDKGELRGVFEVANRFHFFHSLALAAMPLVRRPAVTAPLMILGMVLFCAPCYYRAFTGDRSFSRLAPIGGCCLILAWATMML